MGAIASCMQKVYGLFT